MRLRSLLAAALALALLASCATTTDQTPATDEGRTLHYRMPEDPPSLDPFRAGDDNSLVYVYLIFDGLVEFVPGTLEVRPAVAQSWTVSDDGKTYTFTLRPGVKFHNGREVTADDVVWSVRRALSQDAQSGKDSFFEALEGKEAFWSGSSEELPGVSAPDPHTVVFRLAYPFEPFLSILASEAGSILPREVYADPDKGYQRHPVGCGPYRFESWQPGISLDLKRFTGHWKPAPDKGIDEIAFRFIKSASTAMEQYRAGGIDFTQEIPPGQREAIRAEMPDQFHNWPRLSIFYFGFDHAAGPFAGQPLLRQAVLHAVDRDFMVRVLQEGKDLVASGVITPGMTGFDPDREPPAYDPDLSKRLLAQAGHPNGEGLPEIVYLSNETEGFRRIGERLESDLARVGIRLRVKMLDFGAFLQALTTGAAPEGGEAPAFGLYRMNWYADYPDPDNFLGMQFATGAGGNFGRYSNPAFDRLIDEGRRERNADRRAAIYRQADTILLEDAALVPVYWYGQDIMLKPWFTGLEPSPLGAFGIAWEEMTAGR